VHVTEVVSACFVLKCVVFVEGESLYIDGDVDGAVDAWLNYLQNVPGMFMFMFSGIRCIFVSFTVVMSCSFNNCFINFSN